MLGFAAITTVLALVAEIVGSTLVADKPQFKTKIREVSLPNDIYLINIAAIRNGSAGHVNDVLHNDIIEKALNESTGLTDRAPIFMLAVNDEDEDSALDLNDLAEEIGKEGFAVEKIIREGNETQLVKVHLISPNTSAIIDINPRQEIVEAYVGNRILKTRVKRSISMSSFLGFKKMGGGSRRTTGGGSSRTTGGGSSCGCTCGGCYQQPQVQTRTVYVPVYVMQVQHPRQNVCDPCAHG